MINLEEDDRRRNNLHLVETGASGTRHDAKDVSYAFWPEQSMIVSTDLAEVTRHGDFYPEQTHYHRFLAEQW